MTHHEHPPTGTGAGGAHVPPPGERTEWEQVKSAMDELGDAMSRWASSVSDDPENRKHARDIQQQLQDIGRDIGRTLDTAADSDFVKGMGQAAGKAGDAFTDAAKTVGREVTPFVTTAFRTAAEGIRIAADKIEESARRREPHVEPVAPVEHVAPPKPQTKTVSAEDPAVPSEPPAGFEPPGPAPSGVHEPGEPRE